MHNISDCEYVVTLVSCTVCFLRVTWQLHWTEFVSVNAPQGWVFSNKQDMDKYIMWLFEIKLLLERPTLCKSYQLAVVVTWQVYNIKMSCNCIICRHFLSDAMNIYSNQAHLNITQLLHSNCKVSKIQFNCQTETWG